MSKDKIKDLQMELIVLFGLICMFGTIALAMAMLIGII